jgi:hypothetical protein
MVIITTTIYSIAIMMISTITNMITIAMTVTAIASMLVRCKGGAMPLTEHIKRGGVGGVGV